MTTLVFGHKNPDTDSVASAIALSYLKNKQGLLTKPYVLGEINRETNFVLRHFDVEVPDVLNNVKIQLKDLELDCVKGFSLNNSIIDIFDMFKNEEIKTIPLIDESNRLVGIVTLKDIAIGLINGDIYYLNTSLRLIANSLGGKILTRNDKEIEGKITVIAHNSSDIDEVNNYEIIITSDNLTAVDKAIRSQAKLIIISGDNVIPSKYIDEAEKKNVSLVQINKDIYTTVKLINQCNYILSILKNNEIIQFNEDEYLSEVKEEMINTNYRNYPVVNKKGEYIGFVNKKEIINPHKKKVILVDHNETTQSANGLREAEIIEIVDHHKIGDIATESPINFRNIPLGSTCTIIYQMFKENNIDIPHHIAGLLISGIISDTLLLKSPTSTEEDQKAINELNNILKIDLQQYSMEMFKEGTSLEGFSEEEVFNQDFKDFLIEGFKIGISQVFTLDIDRIIERKEEFTKYISKVHVEKNYFSTFMLVTDILKNGSYLIYQTENINIISLAFGVKPHVGVFIDGIVSRKKQVIPKLAFALRCIK